MLVTNVLYAVNFFLYAFKIAVQIRPRRILNTQISLQTCTTNILHDEIVISVEIIIPKLIWLCTYYSIGLMGMALSSSKISLP